jgi:hypothetical protein
MPVNFPQIEQPKQLSITDAMRDWGNVRDSQINRDQALGDIGREQKVRDYYGGLNGGRPDPSALSAIDPKAGIGAAAMNTQQAQMGVEQIKATKQVATHFTHSLKRIAQQQGIQPGTPEYQQLADMVYRSNPIYAQTMKNVAGVNDDVSKPVDWKSAESIADPTPEEQGQAEIAQKVAEQEALEPGRARIAQIQAGGDMQKIMFQDQLARQRDDQNARQAVALKQVPTAGDMIQQTDKKAERYQSVRKSVSDTEMAIKSIDDLVNLQDKTPTGPILGSAPIAAIRKMAGDDDLALLEKGYAKASLEAIGAMKQLGTTLGALNQKEGEWIRDANASINSTGKVNIETLNKGKAILQEMHNRAKSLLPEKPPKKPGFRTLMNPQTGEYMYKPEGG